MQFKYLALLTTVQFFAGSATATLDDPAAINKKLVPIATSLFITSEVISHSKDADVDKVFERLSKNAKDLTALAGEIQGGPDLQQGPRNQLCRQLVKNAQFIGESLSGIEYLGRKQLYAKGAEEKIAGPLGEISDAYDKLASAILQRTDFCPNKDPNYYALAALEALSEAFSNTIKAYSSTK